MSRAILRTVLDLEGIPESVYSLDGGHPSEALVLDERPPGWAVYYSERGQETGLTLFDSESEACAYMLEQLMRVVAPTVGKHDTNWAANERDVTET